MLATNVTIVSASLCDSVLQYGCQEGLNRMTQTIIKRSEVCNLDIKLSVIIQRDSSYTQRHYIAY